jgi:hypothetical protein
LDRVGVEREREGRFVVREETLDCLIRTTSAAVGYT